MTTAAGVVVIDPMADPRWEDLLRRHPRASVFHTRGWLEALNRTYGYEPIVLTTTDRGPLQNGLAVCRITTWLSRRLVSLPFSDHCEPLVDRPGDLTTLIESLSDEVDERRWNALELRPRSLVACGLATGASYHLHTIDLARSAARVFEAFDPSNTQRAIRRAEREGLTYEAGRSERLLSSFFGLQRQTRRRHRLPPQPLAWFQNLAASLGDALTIHVASKDGRPIASILTLSFKKTVVYKYGASDAAQHRLGGMPFLFWRAIEAAKAQGLDEMDLGRSDLDQEGLLAFKDHLGGTRATLTYYNYPVEHRATSHDGLMSRAAGTVISHLPDAALDLTGRLLYKHFG